MLIQWSQRRTAGVDPIAALFANGEQGAWYDPSDSSTLVADGNGTPVTTAGQTVALVLDKRKGLVRGSELVPNPTFANAGQSWTVSGNDSTHTVTFGANGARYRSDTTSPQLNLTSTAIANAGTAFEVTVVVSEYVSGSLKVSESANGSMIVNGLGTFKAIMRSGVAAITRNSANVDITIQSISIKEIPGNHLWRGQTAQRPVFARDTSGKPYLQFDGTDDSMISDAINMTATDKLMVCAGLRKESDAAIGIVAEFGDNLNIRSGSWYLAAPIGAGSPGLAFVAKGTNAQYNDVTGYPSPVHAVMLGQADIAAPLQTLRINQSLVSTVTNSLGTGTFGNWSLYLGRRGGTTQQLTGRLYGLIFRGAQCSTAEVAALETFMQSKTGNAT